MAARETALIGDSLTDPSFGLTTFYWANGVLGGPLKCIANAGHSGDTVANVLSRVDNNYTDASPGLAGLGALGYVFVRIGTNDARAGTAIAGTLTTQYSSLMTKLAGYAEKVIVLSVPPLAGATLPNDYNAHLSTTYNSGQFVFVDDCVNVRDVSNVQIASFFNVDGIHFNGKGVCQVGIDGGLGLLSSITGYSSQLVTDATDVYATTPAGKQWHKNPTNAGTGGSASSGISGTVATNVSISGNGANVAGTTSIVAADVGDTNQTSWQRVTPTQGQSGSSIVVQSSADGRTITSGDPTQLDLMVEIRFNSLNTDHFTNLDAYMQGTTGEFMQSARLYLGDGTINRSAVIRNAIPRTAPAGESSANLIVQASFADSFGPAASIGTFDYRCFSARG